LVELFETLTRTVAVECCANSYARRALGEVERAYREMLEDMIDCTVEHQASQSTLPRVFYSRFRERYPWLPVRVVKGAYRDSIRRVKSFRELKKRGRAYADKPEVRRVTITYSDTRDWKLKDGAVKLKTNSGWVNLHYRGHRWLHRYLYSSCEAF